MLALGVSLEEAAAGPLARSGSFSGGRDIGVVFNLPGRGGATVLPACGGVGTQYTPAAGWAQAIRYRHEVLADASYARSIAVVLGGDASTATNGFWSALNIATTLQLPLLFLIEDNAFGISVPSCLQTPGGNIAANLRSFGGLTIMDGDGSDPRAAATLTAEAVARVRAERAPLLLRLTVPRLSGHSGQDTQAYKSAQTLSDERARDPLRRLQEFLVPAAMPEPEWARLEQEARRAVEEAIASALARPHPDPRELTQHVFSASATAGSVTATPTPQEQGGLLPEGFVFAPSSAVARPEGPRINMLTAIRRTLDVELALNPRMLVFGEDVGPKGGVHGATLGLQDKYGAQRVFDTSLSEEGIIGRAVGMALAGLLPVAEIQFRKYADPAAEQLNDCGTLRWRTRNRFAAPIVVRMPGGLLQVRRSLAQPDQRSRLGARRRLARRSAFERRGCRGAPARGAARQRSGDLLRAPRHARWRLGAPSVSGGCVRAALRAGAHGAQRRRAHRGHLGRHGGALRAGRRALAR